MHVGDIRDIIVWNTYNVAFWTSSDWLIGGVCGLDLISQNQRCNALSTWGRNDLQLHFWLRTLPASTIYFSLALYFFHVDRVDWLKLNSLQRFYLCVGILLLTETFWNVANKRNKHRVFIWFLMHLFLMLEMSEITSNIH